MLILKHGELSGHKYKRFKCEHCGAIFIEDENEYLATASWCVADCPTCNHTVSILNISGCGDVSVKEYNQLRSQYEQKE